MAIELLNMDCYQKLLTMQDGSVDLFLQDTPFGVTQNYWDIKPNLQKMWPEWLRVGKENCAFIFFATQPFASELISSMPKLFRYDIIWDKGFSTGHLNANKMPMRNHETVLIFYKKLPTYNPQKDYTGKTYHSKFKLMENVGGHNYGRAKSVDNSKVNSGYNFPKSIICFNKDAAGVVNHPTQKPIDLIRYFIRTYSNEYDLVFDGYGGSFSTAMAADLEKRNAIICELDKDYYTAACKRFEQQTAQLKLL